MLVPTTLVLAGLAVAVAVARPAVAQTAWPNQREGNFVLRNYVFESGETLPELRLHYTVLGTPHRNAAGEIDNAVLLLHGTSGTGKNWLLPSLAGELFGTGQPLDASRYFIILPDNLGHGRSAKPSDGLHARFPRYGYRDLVLAQHRLLTEGLKVDHLRLVLGQSMGGMHTWHWGETYPDFMDALMPLASLPTQISGRNRVWRRVIIDAIRNDPAWAGGEYTAEPPAVRTALEVLWLMSSNPVLRQQEAPTRAQADQLLDRSVAEQLRSADANDILYQVSASQDYDPGPALERIEAPLLAVNSADDLINPPELHILEREIVRVPHGRALVIPYSERTHGHGSHTYATLWSADLVRLLDGAPER
jgi:homoserine O-acetyltransferase